MKIITYTFRTFPRIKELEQIFGKVFVFGKLNVDFKRFVQELEREKPELVLGIALSSQHSRIETKALNVFGKNKQITSGGKQLYKLEKIDLPFVESTSTTTSFCNWTAYKIASLETFPNAFIHINENDMKSLNKLIF